jgi:cytoskeletal protein CcmA (bactofilin family)
MSTGAHIGPSIRIKGDVTASEPLVIAGCVEGTIEVEGHPLTILAGGQVTATMMAHTVVIAGTFSGSMNATARILVAETATVEGELSAPAISLADGATIDGRIETTGRPDAAALPLAS